MSVIFHSGVGVATALTLQGARTGRRIDLGVYVDRTTNSPINMISDIWDGLGETLQGMYKGGIDGFIDSAKNMSNDDINKIGGGDLGSVINMALGSLSPIGLLQTALRAAKAGLGDEDSQAKKLPTYSEDNSSSASAEKAEWNQRSNTSLGNLLEDLGIITSMRGNYTEPVSQAGIKVEAGTALQMGTASISGIAFETSCTRTASRHGLEAVLEYYYHHRVSNSTKPMSIQQLKIGATQLDGWVVGMDWAPLNLDFRLWSWSINLFLSPIYAPQVITKGSKIAQQQEQRRADAAASLAAERASSQKVSEFLGGVGAAARNLVTFGL